MKKIVVFSAIILFFCVCLYTAYISLSECRRYSKLSLDNWVLTSAEIAEVAKYCRDEPVFIYRAGDGPKPSILEVNCEFADGVVELFSGIDFVKVNDDHFRKGAWEFEVLRVDSKVISVSQMEYL